MRCIISPSLFLLSCVHFVVSLLLTAPALTLLVEVLCRLSLSAAAPRANTGGSSDLLLGELGPDLHDLCRLAFRLPGGDICHPQGAKKEIKPPVREEEKKKKGKGGWGQKRRKKRRKKKVNLLPQHANERHVGRNRFEPGYTTVLSTGSIYTNSGCGKERRILIGPW